MSYSVASRGSQSQFSQVSRASQGSRGSRGGSQATDRKPSFSPSAAYNPAVNESIRNLVVEDPLDEEEEDNDSALDDQRKGALEEDEENMDMDPEEGMPFFQTQRGKLILMVIVILIIVIAAVLAITLSLRNNDGSKSTPTLNPIPSPAPTIFPRPPSTKSPTAGNDPTVSPTLPPKTQTPTGSPTAPTTDVPTTGDREFRYQTVADALIDSGISDQDDLFPPDGQPTSQTLAMDWLLDEDPLDLLGPNANTPERRVIQRYTLVVLWYNTIGNRWVRVENWLTGAHECDWFGLNCVEFTIPSTPILPEGGGGIGGI